MSPKSNRFCGSPQHIPTKLHQFLISFQTHTDRYH